MKRFARCLLIALAACSGGCQAEDVVRSVFGGRNSNEANLSDIDARNNINVNPDPSSWSRGKRP